MSSAQFHVCVFAGNLAAGDGGGLKTNYSNPTLTTTLFSLNSATYGGGLADIGSDYLHMASCTFSENDAVEHGGACSLDGYNGSGAVAIYNGEFANNTAGSMGGAIYEFDNAVLDASGVTFTGNSTLDSDLMN